MSALDTLIKKLGKLEETPIGKKREKLTEECFALFPIVEEELAAF